MESEDIAEPFTPPRQSKWVEIEDESVLHSMSNRPSYDFGACQSVDDVKIRMIDFAHTLPSQDGLPDAGYIHGLVSLLRSLRECIRLMDSTPRDVLMSQFRDILKNGSKRKHSI